MQYYLRTTGFVIWGILGILAGIFRGEQNHVNGLLLRFSGAAGPEVLISLDRCLD